ncbi:RNA polymerase sigma factor [Chitinophaga lutea]
MSTSEIFDDLEIAKQIADGDEEAFARLFYHYGAIINPIILKIVKSAAITEDVIAEVFLKLWLGRSRLPEISNLSGYIYRAATNIAFNELRKEKNGDHAIQQLYLQPAAETTSQEDIVSVKHLRDTINKAVDALPKQRRRIYQLSREEGLSRSEIAEYLNISENTVKDQLRIALRFIQESVQKDFGIYIALILLERI